MSIPLAHLPPQRSYIYNHICLVCATDMLGCYFASSYTMIEQNMRRDVLQYNLFLCAFLCVFVCFLLRNNKNGDVDVVDVCGDCG